MDRFFDHFRALFGAKFMRQFDDPGFYDIWLDTWASGLKGMTKVQMQEGLKKCVDLSWPPSVGEFRSLCLGEHQLNFEAMFKQAANLAARQLGEIRKGGEVEKVEWPSALLYWSAKNFGMNELRTATWEGNKRAWIDTVNAMLEEESLPPIPTEEVKELAAPGKRTVTDEEARQRIAQAVTGMNMGGPAKTTDEEFGLNQYNDWIKRAHRAHTSRQTMDAACNAMQRMGWNEAKIERFKAKYWVQA